MLGLFGTLNLGTRSLSVQRQGTEIAGQNLANVNNPAYARQRLVLSTALTIPTPLGPQGTGVEVTAIVQLRNALLDRQILVETSVRGSLDAQQQALQYLQANLGQEFNSLTTGADGVAASSGVGGQHGLAEGLSEFFNAWQSLSANPTSLAERQVLLAKADALAAQFNQAATRFDRLRDLLNQGVQADVDTANAALADIAKLNGQIATAELSGGTANELRDMRQQKLEELAKLVNFTTVQQPEGIVEVVIDGVSLVAGNEVVEQLEAYDAGGGQWLVRARSAGTPLTLTSGSLHGTIDARDGTLATLQADLQTLAQELASQVNTLHRDGFGLGGTTGEDFFTGTDAATLRVNPALMNDPARIQASGEAGAPGDNQVALRLAQLGDQRLAALNNQTFHQRYAQSVTALGQALSSVNREIANQEVVGNMLSRQRDSVSGVSLDEEMTDLIRFQKAFEASARLITTIDEMLSTVVNLKR